MFEIFDIQCKFKDVCLRVMSVFSIFSIFWVLLIVFRLYRQSKKELSKFNLPFKSFIPKSFVFFLLPVVQDLWLRSSDFGQFTLFILIFHLYKARFNHSCHHVMFCCYQTKYQAQQQQRFLLMLIYSSRYVQLQSG